MSALQAGTISVFFFFYFSFPINKNEKKVFSVCPFWHEAYVSDRIQEALSSWPSNCISVSNQQRKYTENKERSFSVIQKNLCSYSLLTYESL